MGKVSIRAAGEFGVIKDIGSQRLPLGAWSDASNIRFLDGAAYQFYGHSEAYNSPSVAPQHLLPVDVAGERYWIYTSAAKTYAVSNTAGVAVHTDITHATPRTGVVNQWTSFNFQGIPVLNVGDTTRVPMFWDLVLANKCADVTAWPAGTYCKSLRAWKNMIVALNLTVGGVRLPHSILISHPADPGALPVSYNEADATKDAVKLPIPQGQGEIVDGLELKDSFIVYKENSTHRIDYTGGPFIVANKQVFGMTGLLNRNCAVEFDGYHLAVTSSDIVIHDGYTATSVLDKKARRYFFQNIDAAYIRLVFVFKNPFLNEIFACYPSIGATVCDQAVVYNYVDKTVSFRQLPSVNHAVCGPVDNTLANTWAADADTWDADLTAWNGPDYTPPSARVIMANALSKLYLLDGSASFDGAIPTAYLERRGMGMDDDEHMKLLSGVRARITGNDGDTVIIKLGGHNTDPYADPTYPVSMTHTIGETVSCDGQVEFRYPAIRFESGTAYTWRLDSLDIEIEQSGEW
jgi:hypothetical protein